MPAAQTIAMALNEAARLLAPSASARLDAEVLLAEVLAVPRTRLYLEPERVLDRPRCAAFAALIADRQRGIPLPYLTGRAEFWSLPLEITRDVLVPRPETELLVECALAIAPAIAHQHVIDLGTGCGAIAAAFASERPDAMVVASDRSLAAARVARSNFSRLGLDSVRVVVGDWLAPFGADTLDLVLANPPYISRDEAGTLARELAYEPAGALFAEKDGLGDLERIVIEAGFKLRRGASIIVEHGYRHGDKLRALFAHHGYTRIETVRDLAGHERITHARRSR